VCCVRVITLALNLTLLWMSLGADVNTPDKYGDTPLILAVMDGAGVAKTEAVKALVEAKADVNQV